jgi:hypothetical protein
LSKDTRKHMEERGRRLYVEDAICEQRSVSYFENMMSSSMMLMRKEERGKREEGRGEETTILGFSRICESKERMRKEK